MTLTASLLTGTAVLAAMWVLIAPGHSLAIDRAAFRLLAFDRSEAIFDHGGAAVQDGTYLLVFVVGVVVTWLALAGRWHDACTVLVGFVAAPLLADLLKAIAQRPRPSGEVLYAPGYGFPSSDAALAIGFVVIALVLAPLARDETQRRAILLVGIALMLLISALVIALRDHYLTDVIGGWGLGIASFSGAALAPTVVGRVREHRRR